MVETGKLLDEITVENITKQIEKGWRSPFFITKYMLGIEMWKSLSKDDRMMLIARVNKIVRENNL